MVLRLYRKILRSSARSIRSWRRRPSIRIDDSFQRQICIRLVQTVAEAVQACTLLYDSYLMKGWIHPNASRVHCTAQMASPTTITFIATSGSQVIGTVSLYSRDSIPLPVEEVFPEEISCLDGPGIRIAEVGALCVTSAYRRTGVYFLLGKAMLQHVLSAGFRFLTISVHRRSQKLYRHAYGFRRRGKTTMYPGLTSDAQAVFMYRDLSTMEQDMRREFDGDPEDEINLHFLYFKRTDSQIELPDEAGLSAHSRLRTEIGAKLQALRPDVFAGSLEKSVATLA